MTDLLALAAELVDIPSVSFEEAQIADHLEAELVGMPWLAVDRIGDNLVARTELGRPYRLVLAGHTDTVPPDANLGARIEGDLLYGLGSCDMKGSLAAMLELARTVEDPAVDLTYVFYAREEVASHHSGLAEIERSDASLLAGDAALLGEPTSAGIEAGCQGVLRARLTLLGARAHTARPWMGSNAIHRLAPLLERLDAYQPRCPVIDGCEYREAVQAVWVEGGVAGNVVPDEAVVTVSHRFAPDRTPAQASTALADVVGEVDGFEVTDAVAGAPPSLAHPLLSALIDRNHLPVAAKLGWTDVAFFASRDVPAANFGAGDATIAHTRGEHVTRRDIETVYAALADLVTRGAHDRTL
jgi:succinyl-diaminopimelate desuccinylase